MFIKIIYSKVALRVKFHRTKRWVIETQRFVLRLNERIKWPWSWSTSVRTKQSTTERTLGCTTRAVTYHIGTPTSHTDRNFSERARQSSEERERNGGARESSRALTSCAGTTCHARREFFVSKLQYCLSFKHIS